MKKFVLYLLRWQLSTPIMTILVALIKHSPQKFGNLQDWKTMALANLLASIFFFWVDRYIFTIVSSKKVSPEKISLALPQSIPAESKIA